LTFFEGESPYNGQGKGGGALTVYIDEVFLLNGLIDYLLLLCAGRLAGEELHRGRLALAGALGGLYAALVFLPGWGFLGGGGCKPAVGVLLALVGYGGSRRLGRVTLTFFAVAAAFGGGALALQYLTGSPAAPDLRAALLFAAGFYLLLGGVFRGGTRHGGGELTTAELRLGERSCRLTVLTDTGNTLTDPATGRAVMVCEGQRLAGLFPPGKAPTKEELADPVAALELRGGDGYRWRLLPYRAVGVDCALLLAVKVDRARVGGEERGSILVALSPTAVSDGGGYHGLIGV